jgi:hypothetical protein
VVHCCPPKAADEAKYHFAFWRPYTAIHEADTDGNDATSADSSWIPLDPTPGHPEYPANHGCGTQALMDALTEFLRRDVAPRTGFGEVRGASVPRERLTVCLL